MNDQRPQRSPCSTDSRRNPGSSPAIRRNAETGVVRSARTSRQTGTTECSRARARKSSLLGRSIAGAEGAEEARAGAGVARPSALLLDDEQERVAVTVVVRLAHPLAVSGGVALGPPFLPGTAPEDRSPALERLSQGRLVHPRHHQNLTGARLLDDGGDQP